MARHFSAGEQRTGFFFGKDRVISPDVVDREYHQRLEEGFAWMVREVWVAHEPTQSSSGNWFFVTRRGWSVLDDPAGLARAQQARMALYWGAIGMFGDR